MIKRILLPTDGSDAAERAGEDAIAMADVGGQDIIVLYVIDTSYLNALPQRDLREQLSDELRKEGEEAVEKFKKRLEESQCEGYCKNINLITMIKEGKPADVILKTADEEDVNLIIMGKSGKNGLEKLILGNTTERVVRGAKVPVHVVA
ncbi:MAG: universal stress protein [Methanobacteriaceae archaeon]|jgi:nucleotide-binding universal stress UspA family protein|nr:universal stress protein [Methanobacteriaceae archaeon]OPY24378.1 MAG: Universal stress protein [Methanobacterium sp. PtaU1.Bin097]